MSFIYKADPDRGREWARIFAERAPQLDFRIWPDVGDASRVRFLAAWEPPSRIAEAFPNLEVLFSTGAGVDQFDFAALPEALPVVRMVEPGIIGGMVEYVSWAVLSLHRDMPAYRRQQQRKRWQPLPVHPASTKSVGVLGLGSLGQAVIAQLRAFGFDCAGWSRSPHTLEGMRGYAGWDELPAFLARTDLLVCLLPLTAETRGVLNHALFTQLPRGAALVHVGRGEHLIASDLLAALDAGQLSEAILDVTDPEPLPADDPLWRHPRVVLTPHVASMTQPETAAHVVLDNLERRARGEAMLGLVDRRRGY